MTTATQKAAMETRLLLWLWFAEQIGKTVTQSQAVSKLKRKREAAADYRQVLQGLAQSGAIAIDAKNYCTVTPAGESQLSQGLLEATFELPGTIVGTWVANALLTWMRGPGQTAAASTQDQSMGTEAESQVAVEGTSKNSFSCMFNLI